jgi:hypothetical protein
VTAASISMRSASGVAFGSTTYIGITMLEVECPETLSLGQALEFQLELPGLRETVYGKASVHAVREPREGPARYQLLIQRLRAGDETLLREWVEDMKQGGSSARPHLHVPDSQVSVPSTARTVDVDALPRGAVSTWDAKRTAAAGPGERGRSSVRQRLREHLDRKAGITDAPEVEDTSVDPAMVDIEIEITEP